MLKKHLTLVFFFLFSFFFPVLSGSGSFDYYYYYLIYLFVYLVSFLFWETNCFLLFLLWTNFVEDLGFTLQWIYSYIHVNMHICIRLCKYYFYNEHRDNVIHQEVHFGETPLGSSAPSCSPNIYPFRRESVLHLLWNILLYLNCCVSEIYTQCRFL